jgi:hypothetical protein
MIDHTNALLFVIIYIIASFAFAIAVNYFWWNKHD